MESPLASLTQFPSLFDYESRQFGEFMSVDALLEAGIPEDIIILAWASMLKTYTGEDVPDFLFNKEQVSVDSSSSEIKRFDIAGSGSRSTRVCVTQSSKVEPAKDPGKISDQLEIKPASGATDRSETNDISEFENGTCNVVLCFRYDQKSGRCSLESVDAMEKEHLTELTKQVRSCIEMIQSKTGLNVRNDELVPKQSILNAFPQVIEGPQLLHKLAFHHECWKAQAIEFQNPDKSRTILSYESLRKCSSHFANRLQNCLNDCEKSETTTARPIIPVLIPQSAELYVALLGILEAGAAFCPINTDTPDDRVRFILEDLSAKVLVCLNHDEDKFESVAPVKLCILDNLTSSTISTCPSLDSATIESIYEESKEIQPWDPAYVMYTSGSTGQPKGVVLSHLAVTQSLLAHDCHIPQFSRFLQFASPTFDVSMFEIFFTFFRGCTLVGCNRTELLNDLPGVISNMSIDAAELTPTVAGTLLRTREEVPGLSLLLTIGEMLTRNVIEEFGASTEKSGMLYGMYGPTEAAIHCTLQPKFSTHGKVGLIGRPLQTVSLFIANPVSSETINDQLELVPVGQVGELVVGGPQLADGYLNRPDQTKKAFFEHAQYGMLYRTGDKARMLPSGNVECLGRIQSGQVKLRGQRIELGEIEQVAMGLSGCRLAVASIIKENLILFCLVNDDLTQTDIQAASRKWLLPHMIPNEILLYSSFPQLPSGKVDKKSLESTYEQRPASAEPEAQSSADPSLLKEAGDILEDVLGMKINPTTDFVGHGLDSLRAIQFGSELRRQNLLHVGAADILRARTLNVLISHQSKLESTNIDVEFSDIRTMALELPEISSMSAHVEDILPCTSSQISMLVETMKNSQAYCNKIEINLDESHGLDAVFAIVEDLFKKTEILRSGFVAVEDSSVVFAQVVWKARADAQIFNGSTNASEDFQITNISGLLRPARISISQERSKIVVLLQLHHALYDGWSLDLLLRDIDCALQGSQIQQRTSFRKVVEYYQKTSASSTLDTSRDYWENLVEQVQPMSFPNFPLSEQDPTSDTHIRLTHDIQLDVERFYRFNEIHPQVYIQAALIYLWAGYIGSNDVVIGSVTSGRTVPVEDIENIVGPCITTLPLRIKSIFAHSVHSMLMEIQNQNQNAIEHSLTPLREIKRLANQTSEDTLFDLLFVWQENVESRKAPLTYVNGVNSQEFLESKVFVEAEPRKDFVRLTCSLSKESLPHYQVEIFLQQVESIVLSLLECEQIDDLNVPLTGMAHMLDRSLLHISRDSNAKFSKSDHDVDDAKGHTIKPIQSLLFCSSTKPDWCSLPLGAVGILSSPDKPFDLSKISILDQTKPTPSLEGQLCRVLPSHQTQLLGPCEDFDYYSGQLIHTTPSTASLRDLPFVKDCRTLVVSRDSVDLLVTLWCPKEIPMHLYEQEVHLLPPTDSLVASSLRILETLSFPHSPNIKLSYVLPISSSSIHDERKSNLIEAFHRCATAEYLESFHIHETNVERIPENDAISVEHILIQSLAEILSVNSNEIKRTSPFFRLGLDSVSAISLSRKLRSALPGCAVDISDVLSHPTVGRLARHLLTSAIEKPHDNPDTVKPPDYQETFQEVEHFYRSEGFEVDKVRRCTPLQEAMLASSSSTYNNHNLFEIFLEASKFRSALFEMCCRHEILRTLFSTTTDPNVPFAQVVLKDAFIPWKEVTTTYDDFESTCSDYMDIEFEPLDSRSRPFSVTNITTSCKSYLLLSMHHTLYDGEAMAQLLLEIEEFLHDKPLPTPVPYDLFLEKSLYQDYSEVDEFWLEKFTDFQPYLIPANENKDESRKTNPLVLDKRLDISLGTVERAAQDQSATLSTLCQAAWAKVLSSILGTSDVCFGSVFNGRSVILEGIERLVAPCFNTVPLRIQLNSGQTNELLVQNLQKSNAEIFAYQFTPLSRLFSLLGVAGKMLFDTLILVQKPIQSLDESIWVLKQDVGNMGIPLICEITPYPEEDQLRMQLHADESFMSGQMCEKVAEAFSAAIIACCNSPTAGACHSELSSLKAGKIQKRVVNDNREAETSITQDSNEFTSSTPDGLVLQVREMLSNFLRLPMQEIPSDKSIFRMGLDSINAIQLARLMRKDGFNVTSEDIMRGKSADGIALVIADNVSSKPGVGQIEESHFKFEEFDHSHREKILADHKLNSQDIEAIRPCTQFQSGLISQFLHSAGGMYLNHFKLDLDSNLNLDLIYRAWIYAFEKHEMLRSGFTSTDDTRYPFAMILYKPEALNMPWSKAQVSNREAAEQLRQDTRQRLATEMLESLQCPPWRLFLLSFDYNGIRKHVLDLWALHALYDAESLRMIFTDIQDIYNSKSSQLPGKIEPLLNHILSSADDEPRNREFWSSKLRDVPINKFPNLNPLQVNSRKRNVASYVSQDLGVFDEKCRVLGVTLQAALQVAWARLLADYLGEKDVVFGIILSARESNNADEIAFPSTSTVPFRISVREDESAMLQETMDYNIDCKRYKHVSLPQIARWASIPGSLFDTILVYQPMDLENCVDSMWKIVDEDATVEYPLSVEITRCEPDKLRFRLTFWDDIIPLKHAELLLDQFVSLLRQTVSGHAGIHGTPYNDMALLSALPPKISEIPSEIETLHQFVEKSARLYPDRIALEFVPNFETTDSQQWTYRDLDREGNKIANFIFRMGIKSNSIIAVSFDKCAVASFCMLGILKAGCSFVAIDPSAPDARKTFILEDSQAAMFLTTSDLAREMNIDSSVKIIQMDNTQYDDMSIESLEPAKAVAKGDACYCLYTSGSSGNPKGCILSHENAVQAMLAFQNIFEGRWDMHSRWLQFASFHFDVSVLEQFWSWSVGICVVSTPRDMLFTDLAGSLRRLNITHIDLTPSLARLITPEEIPSLCEGIFITGGEPLKQEVLDRWGESGVIHNGYGPTECTIGCTMYPRVPSNGKPSNIGWQFDNVGTYVLRPGTSELVPRGAVGELCVTGKLVGNGYLRRPELTKESFAYVPEYEETLYRTKDLVRMLYDGSFEFLGRDDDQVKLRGQRLELGEINNAISTGCSEAREVATIITKRSSNQAEQLVSFIVFDFERSGASKDDQDSASRKLRSACESKLPVYMVPTSFIFLDSIPLTTNNKIDQRKLKEIFEENINKSDTSDIKDVGNAEPTENEKLLSNIVAEFLSIPANAITSDSNLFEMGLDSISSFGLARALQKGGFQAARSASILKYHTVHGLAGSLSSDSEPFNRTDVRGARHEIEAFQRKYKASIARKVNLPIQELNSVFPCTPLQQGLVAKALQNESKPYFNSFIYEVNIANMKSSRFPNHNSDTVSNSGNPSELEGLDPSALEQRSKVILEAFRKIGESVPVLRSQFVPTHEGYSQAVVSHLNEKAFVLENFDKSETTQSLLQRYHSAWLQENTDIFNLPFQVCVLQNDQQRKLFVILNIFHGLYDATSLLLLLDNVTDQIISSNQVEQTPSFYSALPFGPLRKISSWEDFWSTHLADATFTPLYAGGGQIYTSHTARLEITPLNQFEVVRRRLNVTHLALIQAVWMVIFQEWSKYSNTIGMVVSGRSIDVQDADKIIGPMFNTIPFSLPIVKNQTWKSVVQRCHDFNISAIPFQHTPLRDIQKSHGKKELFDSLFVFQKHEENAHRPILFEELSQKVLPDYPLAFEAEHVDSNTLRISLTAQDNVATLDICNELLQRFTTILHELLDSPEGYITDTVDVIESLSLPLNGSRDFVDSLSTNNHDSDFSWTESSMKIREKLAGLSGISIDSIHEDTSIYQLGLDSIDAIKLCGVLKTQGFDLPVSEILRQQTIRKMTNTINMDQSFEPDDSHESFKSLNQRLEETCSNLSQQGLQEVFPATPLQESIVSEMITSDFGTYFNHDLLKVHPETDMKRLKEAWMKVFAQRDILRTQFAEIVDPDIPCTFIQIVPEQAQLDWQDIRLPDTNNWMEITQSIERDMATCYNSSFNSKSAQNLIKILAITDQSGAKYLILSMSHALYDGWSLALLHEDVQRAYGGELPQRPEYTTVLSRILQGENTEAQNFWMDSLHGFEGCQFPVKSTSSKRVHRFQRSSDIKLSDIREFCKIQNVGFQALSHVCWSMVLATYTKTLDTGFALVLSGRDKEEVQQVMFPTMNTVLVRLMISGTRSDMLKDAQSNVADLMQFQYFPLRKISELAGIASHQLVNSLFIYQKRPSVTLDQHSLYESVDTSSHVEYPVCAEMEIVDDTLVWRNACSENALSQTESKNLLDQLDKVLSNIVSVPEAPAVEFYSDGRVSICDLAPFQQDARSDSPRAEDAQYSQPVKTNGSLSSDISHLEHMAGPTKDIIIEVLSLVSKIPETRIQMDNTIYHLGLDSISLIKVASALRQRNIHLTVGEMLRAGTVRDIILTTVRDISNNEKEDINLEDALHYALEDVDPQEIAQKFDFSIQDIQRVIPATPAQVFFLSHWQNTQGALFESEFRYKLNGSVTMSQLHQAWNKLVQRNEILRTVFASTSSSKTPVVQMVLKSATQSTDGEESSDATFRMGAEMPTPVKLEARRSGEVTISLSLTIHHALYDAVSLPLLMQQLEKLCRGLGDEPNPTINHAFEQYVAFTYVASIQKMRKAFWTRYFESMDIPDLWKNNSNGQALDLCNRTRFFQPKAFSRINELEGLLKANGIGIQSLFVAFVAITYARLRDRHARGSENVVLGIYLANRSHKIPQSGEVSEEYVTQLAAPTLNLVPIVIESPLQKSALDCAAQIQDHLHQISAFENATVSLWEIKEWTGLEVDCFVNFLSLPEEDSNQLHDEPNHSLTNGSNTSPVNITPMDMEEPEDLQSRTGPERDSVSNSMDLNPMSGNIVAETYVPSWDIEAAVRDSELDIGVFGPADMLDQQKAKAIIYDLCRQLNDIVAKN